MCRHVICILHAAPKKIIRLPVRMINDSSPEVPAGLPGRKAGQPRSGIDARVCRPGSTGVPENSGEKHGNPPKTHGWIIILPNKLAVKWGIPCFQTYSNSWTWSNSADGAGNSMRHSCTDGFGCFLSVYNPGFSTVGEILHLSGVGGTIPLGVWGVPVTHVCVYIYICIYIYICR